VLDQRKATIGDERHSKKRPLSDAEARALLDSVDEVLLARGKSVRRAVPSELGVDDLRGPTGGFRAPMVKVGRRLLVGFHGETLRELLGG